MKIIVLSTCYPRKVIPTQGIFIHRQVKALQQLGTEVHVIQPSVWYPPLNLHKLHPYWNAGHAERKGMFDNEFEGVKIHHPEMFIRMPSRFFSKNRWRLMGEVTGRYIKQNKFLRDADWIYAQFLCHEGYAGTIASGIAGIPLAAIARGDDVHAWPERNTDLKTHLHEVFRKAQLIFAISKHLAADTTKWFSDDASPEIHTLYNGIDSITFSPVGSAAEKMSLQEYFKFPQGFKFLVCIATPVKLKGWLELFDALKQIKNSFAGWKLVVVAPDKKSPETLDLYHEAIQRGIQDYLVFTGALLSGDVAKILKASDGFVLPSYNEGLSNAVAEAMASGLPVIATDVGGHREFIQHEETGMLISPFSVPELVKALLKLVSNDDFRSYMAGKARDAVMRLGTFEGNAALLLKRLNQYSNKKS